MNRCSYTWEAWDEEEGKSIEKRCPEETWSGSKEYCIFHAPSLDKDTELFKQKLKEKLAKKDYNCWGYYFPEEVSFKNKEFKEDANFRRATFQKDADFWGATFQKDAYFIGATFQKDAYFIGATFQEYADFETTTFQKANFRKVTFQKAFFRRATFQKDADFWGATFQNAYFIGATFQKTYFIGATFQKDADFETTTFQKFANFGWATFQKDANFWGATFQVVYFREATFQKFANFGWATFQKFANFSGAVIKEDIEFAPNQIEELDIRFSKFFFRGTITADLSKALFHRTYLENVAFVNCTWPKKIYEEVHMKDEDIDLTFKELETIYRDLKQNMQRHGNYSQAGKFYYREMEMRRKGSDSRKERIWLGLYNLLAGYGEKPERTAISALVTVLAFSVLYWVLDCLRYPMENPTLFQQIKSSVYFSFVTFTTLGLGDIHPENDWGRTLICCEAVIGAFLIALFVVVFARKMMR